EVALDGLEDLDTARGEMRPQVRRVPPPVRIDAAHVLSRGRGRDVAALQDHDASPVRGQMKGRGRARDPAPDDDDLRLDHAPSDAAYPAMQVTSPRAASPWLLLATVWLTLGITFGLMFSFSVFLVPLLEEFGWSRGLAAGAFSLSAV